jgi:hypothetical protein
MLGWFIIGDAEGRIAVIWERVALVAAVAVAIVAIVNK